MFKLKFRPYKWAVGKMDDVRFHELETIIYKQKDFLPNSWDEMKSTKPNA